MVTRVLPLLAASLMIGSAHASDRFSLRYPGWTLYLDLRQPRLGHDPLAPADAAETSRSFSIRLPGKALLSENGLRLPLSEGAFLSFDATFTASHVDPAVPGTVKPAFKAGIGLGVEF